MIANPFHRPSARPTDSAAFTLIEIMVAVSLAAVLLIAFTSSTGFFSTQVRHVTSDLDIELESVIGEISGSVRRAWLLDQPSADRVDVTDALGGVTSYYLSGTDLMVHRPSGATGVLLPGVKTLGLDIGTMERLREDTQVESYGVVWNRAPAGTPMTIPIWGEPEVTEAESAFYDPEYVLGLALADDAIALGFTLSDDAPESFDTHPEVEELLDHVVLTRIVVPMTHLPVLPPMPVYTAPATGKVEICHRPPGNPQHVMTLSVGSGAVQGHIDHGDYIGPCVAQIEDPGAGSLVIELFEARGQDDARPFGPLLGSVTIPEDALPRATYTFMGVNQSTDTYGDPTYDYETYENVTLDTYYAEKLALDNGGYLATDADIVVYGYPGAGGQVDFGTNETGVALVVDPPVDGVPIDLGGMGAVLRPGIPYTLVFRYTGLGMMNFRCVASPKPRVSGVATRYSSDAEFTPRGMEVGFTLDGVRSFTQTLSYDVAVRLTTTIEKLDGRTLSTSAALSSQTAILDPWRGQVTGELPNLELQGQ